MTEGSEISIYYDPMICKLLAHGNTRNEAKEKMRTALDSFVIQGILVNRCVSQYSVDQGHVFPAKFH